MLPAMRTTTTFASAAARGLLAALVASGGALTAQKPANKPAAPAPAPAPPTPEVERFLGVFATEDGLEVEVRADATGRGLLLRPRSLKASLRLFTGKPADAALAEVLAVAEKRIRGGLEPMATGRGEPDAEAFPDRSAMGAAQKAIGAVLPRVGGGVDFSVFRIEPAARRAWVSVRGRSGEAVFEVQWTGSGRLQAVTERKDAPLAVAFAVRRKDWAERAESGASLSVEGRFAGRVLVLEDQGGLVEWRWRRDAR